MAESIFGKSAVSPVEQQQAPDTVTQPVVAETGGTDNQTKPQTDAPRMYSGDEVEKIVLDRLTRERKRNEKEKATLAAKAPTTPIEEDFRSKLSEYEVKLKEADNKLATFRQKNLEATVQSVAGKFGSLDPELVATQLIGSGKVHLEDDGTLVVENISGSLDELVLEYSKKKPYLFRDPSKGGAGTTGPTQVGIGGQMTTDQMGKMLGVSTTKKPLFGR